MKTISQRELRNDSAAVLRQVTQGESFRVTTRGTPVAVVSPISEQPLDGLVLREGSGDFSFPPGAQIQESAGDALRELRGDR
ncbi:MAG: type II toxin-antitoxin system Phd/YefM family antitoxin [Brachybacterium sp.]|uniref:type II toxin-antitoxin system Phd/YefM family antitoxin n=1 Tax=unclassified Brachybacterium TaxID=2623841 RepID=UPI003F90D1B6